MVDFSVKNDQYIRTFRVDKGDKLYYLAFYGLPLKKFGYIYVELEALTNNKIDRFFYSKWRIIDSDHPSRIGKEGILNNLVHGNDKLNEWNIEDKFCKTKK